MTRCRCGHDADVHEHYRAGTDCGLCPCRAYLPVTVVMPPRGPLARAGAALVTAVCTRLRGRPPH